MSSNNLRKKFLDFFKKKGYTIVSSSSLLPTDPSVLLTTAGMQQFKDYYLGKPSPFGNAVASCQKCFRTSDIDEVGDERHLTFFEMLGNFSFGYPDAKESYFKKEAIELAFEFITKELKLEIDYISVFKGDSQILEDKESAEIWSKLGVSAEKIKKFGREDNFWGPAGEEGPCGPTTEIYVDGVEVWNIVFNEFYCAKDKTLTPLKQKGVDTGMGLERLAMVAQKKSSVFETDLFQSLMQGIAGNNSIWKRIIADHIKGSVFLIADGILPSNVERGYVLRRILRRAIRFGKLLDFQKNFLIPLAQKVIDIYKDVYPELQSKQADILTVIQNEEEKFEETLERGLKILHTEIRGQYYKPGQKITNIPDVTHGFTPREITPEWLFKFYQSFALDPDLVFEEIGRELHRKYTDSEKRRLISGFNELMKKHQEISRAGVEGKFGGHGIGGHEIQDTKYEIQKLHTATHLLHQALREVLGKHIQQMGSDITPQRLRFDFSHPQKLSQDELEKIEKLVNQKIKDDLEVRREEMPYKKALEAGALAFFKEKYPEIVNVYSIISKDGNVFSKEICAGPHVKRTSELGKFELIKEESSGAGVRRIRAILR